MKLFIENVRSFAGFHTLEIRPLTLLVGENSAGKSTLLATLAAVSDVNRFPAEPNLNKEPYDLGSYRTIATFKGGKSGRARAFALGFCAGDADNPMILARYKERKGEAVLLNLKMKGQRIALDVTLDSDLVKGTVEWKGEAGVKTMKIERPVPPKALSLEYPVPFLLPSGDMLKELQGGPDLSAFFDELIGFSTRVRSAVPSATSIAPIRSKPRRVYDGSEVAYEPTGEHVPYALAKVLNDEQEKQHQPLTAALSKFGAASGLFKRIKAPLLRHHPASPFQIEVQQEGPPRNLLDVGYGVSQSLPIIAESVLAKSQTMLLIQQPEVHLHPKAQAALGTFFVDMVRDAKRQFVVETHSDFIIDRIRQEVANKKVPREEVAIIYLRKGRHETTAHFLELDALGNILGAPPHYREFFLREELDLLNRAASR